MPTRLVLLMLFAQLTGCADTIVASQGTIADGAAPDAAPPVEAAWCGRMLPAIHIGYGALLEAVRADGDNTAVFWFADQGTPRPPVMMQRFGPLGEAVDRAPIPLALVSMDPAVKVTATWVPSLSEPALLICGDGVACSLRVGGLHAEVITRDVPMIDPATGAPLLGGAWLRPVEGGLMFFALTLAEPRRVARILVTPQGELRSTRVLALTHEGTAQHLQVVSSPDGGALVATRVMSTSHGIMRFSTLDARGDTADVVGTWEHPGALLDRSLVATRSGFLLVGDVGASAVATERVTASGPATSTPRVVGLAPDGVPIEAVAANGQPFVVVAHGAEQSLLALDSDGRASYSTPIVGAGDSPALFRLVSTHDGGMAILAAQWVFRVQELMIAPLRSCP